MIISLKDKGFDLKTKNFGLKLIELIKELPKDETNEIVFESGVYELNINEAIKEVIYMTNTVSEKEMRIPERKIGIKLENINNLILNGNGATLLYEGRMTEFYLHNCNNVTIKNFIIDNRNPSVAEFDVLNKSLFSVEIKPTINSYYKIQNNKIKWDCEIEGGNYVVQECNREGITRRMDVISWGANPFKRQLKAKLLENGNIKIIWPFNIFSKGYRYQLRNQLRDGAGFFIDRCQDIVLDNIIVHFMHGMGVLSQVSKNITIVNSKFIPNKEMDRTTTAFADMVHSSMCSGLVKVVNCEFDGAHDDVLNVHGNHFDVVKVSENKINALWKHAQAYGFNPIDEGDIVDFIDKGTLGVISTNKVKNSKMLNPRTIEIELSENLGDIPKVCALEIANKTADLLFENNVIKNIPTRGVLVTTRGKVRILNNKFIKTNMAGVLISDDASSWYESGFVRDVEISGNLFDKCQGYVIDIYPEAHDLVNKPMVHKNIKITNNHFIMDHKNILRVKRSEDILFKNNKIEGVKVEPNIIDSKDIIITLD